MRTQFATCVVGFVVVSVCALTAQTIPERVRANPHLPIAGGIEQDVRPVPLEALSKQASLVLVGRLHSPRSYLTRNEMAILTDYAIQPEQVLAGSLAVERSAPGPSAAPILTLDGGELTIDGTRVSMRDRKMERPMPGRQFLMFLEPFGTDPGRYKAVYGAIFEVQNDRLRGLLKMANGADPYTQVTDRTLAAVLPEIARARR